ncbi:MAG: hypothetical protein AB8I08_18555 [Sandaracinaceae bacterium]
MRRSLETLLVPAVFCGALSACGAPAASSSTPAAPTMEVEDGHTIQLTRPAAVGDRFQERGLFTRRRQQRVTVDGQAVEEETTEQVLEMALSTQVMEVNARGAAMVTVHTVERAVLRDANGESQVVPVGSVIRVRRVVRSGSGEEGSIELVDGTLSEEALDVLDMAFSTTVSPTGDDDVFGTDTPRQVGDSWPIDTGRAAQDLNKIPSITIAEGQVTGQTQLQSVEEVRGVRCLIVRGEMRAEGFDLSNLPEGSEVTTSQMDIVMIGALPLDTEIHRLAEATEMRMHVRVELPAAEGRSAQMEMVVEQAARREFER